MLLGVKERAEALRAGCSGTHVDRRAAWAISRASVRDQADQPGDAASDHGHCGSGLDLGRSRGVRS